MKENIKTTILKNKTVIIASVCISLFAFIIIAALVGTLLFENTNFLDDFSSFFSDRNSALCGNNKPVERNIVAKESRVVDAVEQASPAVVSIVITKDVPIIERHYQEFNPFGNDFFNDFFNNGSGFRVPQYKQKGTEKREVGGGSGFFVSQDGFVVTNRHVVNDEEAEYTVLTNDGKKHEAKVLAKDPTLDVAILKVKGNDFPYLHFESSDILKPGQTAIAIGNALGEFRNSVSVGVVSGLSRSIVAGDSSGKSESLEGVIQTDAAINPGNSGGPLLDIAGNVIGVNVAVERGAQNIGFALPSNMVKSIVDSVKKHGEIVRPYLGIRYIQVTKNLQKKNNLPVDYGALVIRGKAPEDLAVIPGSPADKAGLVENDIILEVDGTKLGQSKSLASLIRQKQVGQTITLKILHKGEEKTIKVTLKKAPSNL